MEHVPPSDAPRRRVDPFKLLRALDVGGGVRQSEFLRTQSQAFGVSTKTIRRNLGPMVQSGLVIRETDPNNSSCRILRLDPELGREVLDHTGYLSGRIGKLVTGKL
jgi:DNA-binding MarR family transcriptional regulator